VFTNFTLAHQYPEALAPYNTLYIAYYTSHTSTDTASVTGFTPLVSLVMCVKMLRDVCDAEVLSFLISRPETLIDFIRLTITVHSYLNGLGLRRLEDYVIELSMWVDVEVEDWRKAQIVVKLRDSGISKINEKGLEEFKLLENILRIASELVSQEILAEILISVE